MTGRGAQAPDPQINRVSKQPRLTRQGSGVVIVDLFINITRFSECRAQPAHNALKH